MSITFNLDMSKDLFDNRIKKNVDAIIKNGNFEDRYAKFIASVIDEINVKPKREWMPHVGGWYYINMVTGTWADELISLSVQFPELSPNAYNLIKETEKLFPSYLKEIDPPQINLDHETISGRVRNINMVTRLTNTSEVSVTMKDNNTLDVFKYHEIWRDYIDAYKKGFCKPTSSECKKPEAKFIDIPYFNAIWVAIFKPFTFELTALIKIIGVAPNNIPLKDIIGQRSQPQATTYSMSYKCNDIIMQIYGREKPSGSFYEEFIKDQKTALGF